LAALGYYSGKVDGHFGAATKHAVRAFQESEGLSVDGLVGGGTQKRLAAKAGVRSVAVYTVRPGDTLWSIARATGARPADLVRLNELRDASRLQIGQRLKVPQETLAARRSLVERPPGGGSEPVVAGGTAEMLPWSDASKVFPNGARARVTDVETGTSFWVHRLQGTYHADSEPVTAADTEVVRRLYGGRWSWDRRAIWVEVNGRVIAASMNGYPHGRKGIGDNRYPGHFCIHFYGSRLHNSGRLDPQHQAAVLRAAKAGQIPGTARVGNTAGPADNLVRYSWH
jgi:LysM repeat protein